MFPQRSPRLSSRIIISVLRREISHYDWIKRSQQLVFSHNEPKYFPLTLLFHPSAPLILYPSSHSLLWFCPLLSFSVFSTLFMSALPQLFVLPLALSTIYPRLVCFCTQSPCSPHTAHSELHTPPTCPMQVHFISGG